MSELAQLIKKLAARKCGTNSAELVKAYDTSSRAASSALELRVKNGSLHRIAGKSSEVGHISHQYFLFRPDSIQWDALPVNKRPNAAIKRSRNGNGPAETGYTWRRSAPVGSVTPAKSTQVRVVPGMLGFDRRYACSPEESEALKVTGYFSSGEYRK